MSCFRHRGKASAPPQWHSINLPPPDAPLLRARLGKALSEDVAGQTPMRPHARTPSRPFAHNYCRLPCALTLHTPPIRQSIPPTPPSALCGPRASLRLASGRLGCDSSSLESLPGFVPAAKLPIPVIAPFSGSLCRVLHSIRCLLPTILLPSTHRYPSACEIPYPFLPFNNTLSPSLPSAHSLTLRHSFSRPLAKPQQTSVRPPASARTVTRAKVLCCRPPTISRQASVSHFLALLAYAMHHENCCSASYLLDTDR